MPLIHSPRHRPEDLAAWDSQSQYDGRLTPLLKKKPERAQQIIREFADAGGCYVGTSWGKDSTVLAHLAATSGITLPLVHVTLGRYENPDSTLVRDAFLADYGDHVHYDEIAVPTDNVARWWHADTTGMVKHAPDPGFLEARGRHGARHISGVRADESTTRRLTVRRNGESSATTCRPLAHWTSQDIYLYLHAHDLPIHPSYAMNLGGARHRDTLRVSSIGGERGTGMGRAEWERTYYPEIVGT